MAENYASAIRYRTSSPITAQPATFSCWFNPDDVTGIESHIFGGYREGFSDAFRLFQFDNFPSLSCYDGTAFLDINGTAGQLAVGTWVHLVGRSSGATDHELYVNGVSETTSSTSCTPTIDDIGAGGFFAGALEAPIDGNLAECGAWNVSLSDEEIAALAHGFTPDQVRPDALVGYYMPFDTFYAGNDFSGNGNDLDNSTGTITDAAHPPQVYRHTMPKIAVVPAAVVAANAPQLMMMGVGN